MLGLAWLTQMQKQDGNWVYEAGNTGDKAAATGMAVLAFLGAGQSHKEGRYKQTVQAGLDWLVKNVKTGQAADRGQFATITNMYSQGIATLALCEAYGMTRDPALKVAAQAAVDYIQRGRRRTAVGATVPRRRATRPSSAGKCRRCTRPNSHNSPWTTTSSRRRSPS